MKDYRELSAIEVGEIEFEADNILSENPRKYFTITLTGRQILQLIFNRRVKKDSDWESRERGKLSTAKQILEKEE